MNIVSSISYDQFNTMMNTCFPEEEVDELTFLNNIDREQYLFAGEKDIPYGYVLFDEKSTPARLIHLCVAQKYRSQGVGAFLVKNLVGYLRSQGSTTIRLNVDTNNPRAIAFYHRVGFYTCASKYQYSCIISDDTRTPDVHIRLVTKADEETMSEQFNLGSSVLNYFMTTRKAEFYMVLNRMDQLQGYFMFYPGNSMISPIFLKHPESIDQLLLSLPDNLPEIREVKINSMSKGVGEHLEENSSVKLDYHLLVLELDIKP